MIARHPLRGLIGTSEPVYRVFAAPQHRHLFTGILSYLTDSTVSFTVAIVRFSLASAFLRYWTSIFKRVDTPSIEAVPTPVGSPVSSRDALAFDSPPAGAIDRSAEVPASAKTCARHATLSQGSLERCFAIAVVAYW
eukprot:s902_g8.t1